MMSLTIDPVLLSVSTILVREIFGEAVTLYPFIGAFMINILVSIFFCLFLKEIVLMHFYSVFKKNETCFRIHHRTFSTNHSRLNHMVSQRPFSCTLCDNMATMVHFDCGHVALCNTCYKKIENKNIKLCLLCGKQFQYTV